jgi:molybdopterin synthase sulfur carrier subunit
VTASSNNVTTTGHVTLRYWASARAAAGTDTEALEVTGPVSLADLLARARAEAQ